MNASARAISVVSALLAPCKGRSDAMMNCGLPLPLYCNGPQEDDGRTEIACLLELARPDPTTAPAAQARNTPSRIRFFIRSSRFEGSGGLHGCGREYVADRSRFQPRSSCSGLHEHEAAQHPVEAPDNRAVGERRRNVLADRVERAV